MNRQKKWPNTATFRYFNANPKNRITGDCAFRAISVGLEQDYNQTVMEMAELMCKTGYALNDLKGEDKYLASKGWKKMKQPRHKDGTKYTGEEFCKVIQKWVYEDGLHGQEWDDGIVIAPRIVAHIGGHHIVAIIDGVIQDIWDSSHKTIGNYWIEEK